MKREKNQSLCTVCYIAAYFTLFASDSVATIKTSNPHILLRFIKLCKTILETGQAALCTPQRKAARDTGKVSTHQAISSV